MIIKIKLALIRDHWKIIIQTYVNAVGKQYRLGHNMFSIGIKCHSNNIFSSFLVIDNN